MWKKIVWLSVVVLIIALLGAPAAGNLSGENQTFNALGQVWVAVVVVFTGTLIVSGYKLSETSEEY